MESFDSDKYMIDTRRVVGAIRDALTLEEGREFTIIGSTIKMLIYAYQEMQTRDIYMTSPCLLELDIKSYYTSETSRQVSTLLCVVPFKKALINMKKELETHKTQKKTPQILISGVPTGQGRQ